MKNRVVVWVLAGLLILSLSALGTMLYHRFFGRVPQKAQQECGMRCNLLTEELGLSETQAKKIGEIRAGHRVSAMAITDSLRSCRSELVTELSRETPDTLHLRQLAHRIGMLQTMLTNMTIDQYLLIRNECTPEQQEKLASLYYEIMGCCPAGEGSRMREQCRMR